MNGDIAEGEIEQKGCKAQYRSRGNYGEQLTEKELKKVIAYFSECGEWQNGEKGDKQCVIADVPPAFWEKKTFFVQEKEIARRRYGKV